MEQVIFFGLLQGSLLSNIIHQILDAKFLISFKSNAVESKPDKKTGDKTKLLVFNSSWQPNRCLKSTMEILH